MSPRQSASEKPGSRRDNKNSLYLLYNLVSRDFKVRYRRSMLGVLWSLLNPLLMMVVMSIIFSNIFRWEFDAYPYPVYLILGQVFFAIFQDGTNGCMRSIIDAGPLIKKVYIEKIIFPTEKVLFAIVNFALSLIAVALVMIFFGVMPSWKIIALPVLLVLLVLFTLGVGYLVSALTVYFRDIEHLWGVLTTLWFYLTPIFWPLEALQENGISWVAQVIQFNPMYHFVACFRQMITGCPLASDIGIMAELGLCAVFAVITFAVGLITFKKLEKKFILYI